MNRTECEAEVARLRAWIEAWRRDGIDEGYTEGNSPQIMACLRGEPAPKGDGEAVTLDSVISIEEALGYDPKALPKHLRGESLP